MCEGSRTRLITIRIDNSMQEWNNCWKLSMRNVAIYIFLL